MNQQDNQPVAAVQNLTKIFTDFWRRPKVRAVDNLDFELRRGEVFGLLGPNGSGKSTTIKMLLGLLRPTSGQVRILGSTPQCSNARARIGYLPEISHLHQFLTPRETLAFFGGLFDLPRNVIRERSAQLLTMVDLEHAADRPVGEFSKGMARRVGLAQALINNPELIILDEPTSGLDPIGRHDVKRIVRALAAAGKTVMLSSHLLGEIEDICDRVAIMHRGKLHAEGRLDKLLEKREQVRLTLPEMPPETLEQVCGELERRLGTAPITDHPAMTLEEFFLEALERADGGSGSGTVKRQQVAEFLSGTRPHASNPNANQPTGTEDA